MRKWLNVKTLGLLAVAGAALLFAGCNQQAGGAGGTGTGGAVTSVGISLSESPVSGDAQATISVNEDAAIAKVELYIDDVKVGEVSSSSLKGALGPQAVTFTMVFDSAKLGDDGQPLWKNGEHTIKAVVTDQAGNAKSASTNAIFDNADYIRGLIVSQSDNPKAPLTVGGTKWYGNGDVKVTVDIVNYSGASYEIADGVLSASGGTGSVLPDYFFDCEGGTFTPQSGEPAVLFAKSENDGVEDSVACGVWYEEDEEPVVVAEVEFGLDNLGPRLGSASVQIRTPTLDRNFADLNGYTSGAVRNGTTLFRGSGGVDATGVTYFVDFVNQSLASDKVSVELPDDPSAGVTVPDLANTVAYNVKITGARDGLGNETELDSAISAGAFQRVDGTVEISNVTLNPKELDAGDTFQVTLTVSDDAEASCDLNNAGEGATWGVGLALLDGDVLAPLVGSTYYADDDSYVIEAEAYYGASYALVAIDSCGNMDVYPLSGLTVNQPATDTTGPEVSIDPIDPVEPGASVSPAVDFGDGTLIVELFYRGNVAGYELFDGHLGVEVVVPEAGPSAINYVGTDAIYVAAKDGYYNFGSAKLTFSVEQ